MSGPDDPTRAYLTAIADALTIPLPATALDDRPYTRLLESRVSTVLTSLRAYLADGDSADAAFDAGWIRKSVTDTPVAYEPHSEDGS